MTPDKIHARVLEALDRQIRALQARSFPVPRICVSAQGEPLVVDTRPRDLAALEGRRNILQRHAPEVGINDIPYCYRCAGQWPCPDWRDASAGLEEPGG